MKKIDSKKAETPELEINIVPILKEILKRLWLIVLVGLVVGGAVFVGTKIFVKPIYRSGFTAYVNNKQSKESTDYLSSSDISASKQLVLTYQRILTSNTILTASATSMGFDATYNTLQKMDNSYVEAAQDLGASRWQSFWKVIVPLSMPGVYSGIVMVFMPTVSTFAIAELLTHNNIKLFGSLIQDYITTTDLLNYGAVLSLVLLVIIALTSFFGDNDDNGEKGGMI